MKHIILDTDPGVDDALAFLLAFGSKELEVEAVTTVAGNVSHAKGHRNAKQLLEFLGRTDVPVCRGAEKPLVKKLSDAEGIHGSSGLGGAVLPEPTIKSDTRNATQMIHEKAAELGKDLTLVAIGPLTNIAAALLGDPGLPSKIGGLVIMGGAFGLTPYGQGNANPVAEFNVWHDPEAARMVFNSGFNVVCVGLDTTTHPDYRMGVDMFNEIKALDTRRSGLVVDLCGPLVERLKGFSLHDPMAVAYLVDPSIFKTERHIVDVETRGELTVGMTVVDRRRFHRAKAEPNAEIIVEVDAPRFHRLIMDRVARG
ncbi:nucleoside hydrolase [Candidatus Bathyarchaeota archaeon]|nr:nucleoside hydrolase [Candidatus Bathyarchaeota archaeon]